MQKRCETTLRAGVGQRGNRSKKGETVETANRKAGENKQSEVETRSTVRERMNQTNEIKEWIGK